MHWKSRSLVCHVGIGQDDPREYHPERSLIRGTTDQLDQVHESFVSVARVRYSTCASLGDVSISLQPLLGLHLSSQEQVKKDIVSDASSTSFFVG